jgi:hypothetical protein
MRRPGRFIWRAPNPGYALVRAQGLELTTLLPDIDPGVRAAILSPARTLAMQGC